MIERDAKGCWVPGSSPNPSGRPAGSISLETRLKKRLRENPKQAEKIIDTLIAKSTGKDADPAFLKIVLDRHDGPVRRVTENWFHDEAIFRHLGDTLAEVYPDSYEKGELFLKTLMSKVQEGTKRLNTLTDETDRPDSCFL